MNCATDPIQRLLVVLDADFGDRLRQSWHGQPVWIVMSPVNEPVIRSLWATYSGQDHLTGVTGFRFDSNIAAEDSFIADLGTIDLHHGPYSTSSPYTILDVIAARRGYSRSSIGARIHRLHRNRGRFLRRAKLGRG